MGCDGTFRAPGLRRIGLVEGFRVEGSSDVYKMEQTFDCLNRLVQRLSSAIPL